MEGAYKLKVKIGQHEFEAEGSQEAVERQFQTFSELVKLPVPVPSQDTPKTLISKVGENSAQSNSTMTFSDALDAMMVKKIFHLDGDIVSLTVLPRTEDRDADAALVILFGYQFCASNPTVSGDQIYTSLKQSGITVDRVDRLIKPFVESATPLVLKRGIRRGVKYRLTNQGVARAKALAEEMAKLLP